jgi:hypothetical protein
LFALLAVVPSVHAQQSTRANEIAAEQAAKATTLEPEEGPRWEQLVARLRLGVSPEGFYPWIGSVFPGGGLALGAGYQHHLPRGAVVGVSGGWSGKNYKMVEGRAGVPLQRDNRLRVDGYARWTDAPKVRFYGFGPDSNEDDLVRFGYRPVTAAVMLTAFPQRWLYLRTGYDRLRAHTTEDQPLQGFSLAETPGLLEDLSYHVLRAGIAIDTRTSPEYSDRGGLYRFDWTRFAESHDRPYSFDQAEVEFSQLVPLVGRYFVLAFRGLGTFTDPGTEDQVPVVLAPYVGSSSTLRAFHNRRFQDRHRVVLNGEYRWQPSRYLNMAVFYDAGQVAPDVDQFRMRDFVSAWGIGARFHGPTFTVLRLELARGREGWILVAGGSQPF